MSRDDKRRKKERKARNAATREAGPIYEGDGRNRWQGSVSFQLGKDPRTRLDVNFSGVKVPVDLADPDHMEGVAELTTLALKGDDGTAS